MHCMAGHTCKVTTVKSLMCTSSISKQSVKDNAQTASLRLNTAVCDAPPLGPLPGLYCPDQPAPCRCLPLRTRAAAALNWIALIRAAASSCTSHVRYSLIKRRQGTCTWSIMLQGAREIPTQSFTKEKKASPARTWHQRQRVAQGPPCCMHVHAYGAAAAGWQGRQAKQGWRAPRRPARARTALPRSNPVSACIARASQAGPPTRAHPKIAWHAAAMNLNGTLLAHVSAPSTSTGP